jgi:hypothetical protein
VVYRLQLAAWPGKPDAYWPSFYKSVAVLQAKDAGLALKIGLLRAAFPGDFYYVTFSFLFINSHSICNQHTCVEKPPAVGKFAVLAAIYSLSAVRDLVF